MFHRSDVLGSYNSTTSSESSIKFIDEDSSMRNSIILETSAEVHPVPASPTSKLDPQPKPILAKTSLRNKRRQSGALAAIVDRHQQTSSPEELVKPASSIIVPTLKVDKGSSSTLSTGGPHQKCSGLNQVVEAWETVDNRQIIHRTSSPVSQHSLTTVSSVRSEDAVTNGGGSDISSILGPDKEHVLSEKMHHIVTNFRNRAFSVRQRLEEAPSPEDESVLSEEDEEFLAAAQTSKKIRANHQQDKGLLEKLTE